MRQRALGLFLLAILGAMFPTAAAAASARVAINDPFDRRVTNGWGQVPTGGSYSLLGNNQVMFSVDASTAWMSVASAGAGGGAVITQPTLLDTDVKARVQFPVLPRNGNAYAYITARRVAAGSEYRAQLRVKPDGALYVRVSRVVDNTELLLGTDLVVRTSGYQPGSAYVLRMQLTGSKPTTLRVKAWADGAAEPTAWLGSLVDATAALQAPGSVGVRSYVDKHVSNAPFRIGFLDLMATTQDAPPTNVPSQPDLSSRIIDLTTQALAREGVAVKDTNYPIPSTALFVAPYGNDMAPGTKAAPLRTLAHAVSIAPNRATIVLREGVYHERVSWYAKQLTLQPYPHERVWLSGSTVITNWTSVGGKWRAANWTATFKQGGLAPEFIDPAYPLAAHPDMVFIDGQPLRQVSSLADVRADSFWVDYARQELWIGTDPKGKLVAGTALDRAIYVNQAHGSVIRGLGFMHYGTHVSQGGAVTGDARQLIFTDNTFAWNAAAGLSVLGTDSVVRNNLFIGNGQLGLHAHRADRLLVEGNHLLLNNAERFSMTSAEGGLKVTTTRDTIWRNNLSERNYGRGLWADVSSYNVTIVRNVVRNNLDRGIQVEISAKALIASNIVANNGDVGIYVLESQDVDVYNNTLSRNKQNIRVFEGTRRNTADRTISWDVSDVVIRNNILSNGRNGSVALLGVDNLTRTLTGEQMRVSTDYNAYYRDTASAPNTLLQWSRWPVTILMPKSGDDVVRQTRQELHSVFAESQARHPWFANEAAGDLRLRGDSGLTTRGVPLPANVAAAVGAPAGVPVMLGAFQPADRQRTAVAPRLPAPGIQPVPPAPADRVDATTAPQ